MPPLSASTILIHNNLAHAYEDTGKLKEANIEYIATEKSQENILADVESKREGFQPYMYRAVKAEDEHKLRIILEDHARVLRRMAKIRDAEAVEQKAAVLAERQ